MRLALQTDYALRTLIYLAGRPGRSNVQAVADFYQISRDHVAKVVRRLGQLGYIRNIRGAGGGIELARRADDIRVGQVVLDFEGQMHLLECVGTDEVCVIQPGCRLRRVLAEAERIQVEYLQAVRLSDVIQGDGQLVQVQLPETSSGGSLGTIQVEGKQ